jgi:hypothetical protein
MFSFLASSKPTLDVVPVTNQFAWGLGMGCAQGSDVIGMRMIGAWNAPSAVRPEWPPLPPEVALPMIASANARGQHVTLLAATIGNKLAFDVSAEPSPATPPE